jgi:hypothetical protein
MRQHKKLKAFKDATYEKALTGQFSRVDELHRTLVRDLMATVRELKPRAPPSLILRSSLF